MFASSAAGAANSIWAQVPGKIYPTDQTVWCDHVASSVNGVYNATVYLNKVNTDGTIAVNGYSDAATKVAVRMQCMDGTGQLTAPVQSQSLTGTATVACPSSGQLGVYVKCQIASTDSNPFVYAGSYGGDPCASGVASVSAPAGTNGFKGQITGQRGLLNFSGTATPYNVTNMTTAHVWGTDMGYSFWSQGKLWFGYGDTWENVNMDPVAPIGRRGSILFTTTDLNPSDGLSLTGWVGGNAGAATEVVPSCHNTTPCSEGTAIADAGFSLTEGSTNYRILWFASFTNLTFQWIGSSVAWSVNGGAYTRGDLNLAPGGTTPPRWLASNSATSFGAGAIWQDRLGGYIYFFGERPYVANTPIRMARVPAKFASVVNANAYQYWNGSNWQSGEAGLSSPAADVIPASANAGPEFSVAFDPYVNTFLMMFVANRWNGSTAAVQLWQTAVLTNPSGWTKVNTGSVLPNTAMAGGTYPGSFWYFYGPYMNEQLMMNGGQSVYYQLSEWNGLKGPPSSLPPPAPLNPAGLPYEVGLWTYNLARTNVTGCMQ